LKILTTEGEVPDSLKGELANCIASSGGLLMSLAEGWLATPLQGQFINDFPTEGFMSLLSKPAVQAVQDYWQANFHQTPDFLSQELPQILSANIPNIVGALMNCEKLPLQVVGDLFELFVRSLTGNESRLQELLLRPLWENLQTKLLKQLQEQLQEQFPQQLEEGIVSGFMEGLPLFLFREKLRTELRNPLLDAIRGIENLNFDELKRRAEAALDLALFSSAESEGISLGDQDEYVNNAVNARLAFAEAFMGIALQASIGVILPHVEEVAPVVEEVLRQVEAGDEQLAAEIFQQAEADSGSNPMAGYVLSKISGLFNASKRMLRDTFAGSAVGTGVLCGLSRIMGCSANLPVGIAVICGASFAAEAITSTIERTTGRGVGLALKQVIRAASVAAVLGMSAQYFSLETALSIVCSQLASTVAGFAARRL
jgi:hypothetical protein